MSDVQLTAQPVPVRRAVAHQLTDLEAQVIRVVLWSTEHIPVDVHVDQDCRVNIWPIGRKLTVLEEVTALRAFASVSDAPLRWFPGVAS
jgi:hypothetical protein